MSIRVARRGSRRVLLHRRGLVGRDRGVGVRDHHGVGRVADPAAGDLRQRILPDVVGREHVVDRLVAIEPRYAWPLSITTQQGTYARITSRQARTGWRLSMRERDARALLVRQAGRAAHLVAVLGEPCERLRVHGAALAVGGRGEEVAKAERRRCRSTPSAGRRRRRPASRRSRPARCSSSPAPRRSRRCRWSRRHRRRTRCSRSRGTAPSRALVLPVALSVMVPDTFQ
jgi:hypothetical protein